MEPAIGVPPKGQLCLGIVNGNRDRARARGSLDRIEPEVQRFERLGTGRNLSGRRQSGAVGGWCGHFEFRLRNGDADFSLMRAIIFGPRLQYVMVDANPSDNREIERKYLLRALPSADLLADATALEIDQGYLPGVRINERLRR